MVDQPADYSQAYNFLYKIDRRIRTLERDATFIEKQVEYLDNKKFKTFEVLGMEISELHETLAQLKIHLGKCTHKMSILGKDMRDAVKKDDVQSLNSSIDAVQFEQYVTKKDVDRGVM